MSDGCEGATGGIAHRRIERAGGSWVLSQGSDAYLILVIVGDGALVDRTGGIGGLVSSDRSRKAEILASRDEGRKVRVMSRGSYRLDRGSRRLGVAISLRVAAVFDAPERLRIVAGGEGGVPVSVEGLKGKKRLRLGRGEANRRVTGRGSRGASAPTSAALFMPSTRSGDTMKSE